MGEIVPADKISDLVKKTKKAGKSICLVGGCFDILHPGHVIFLEKAKKEGDILVVLLESDQKVRQLKGLMRPVHTQTERALILSSLRFVDLVVMLPFLPSDKEYDQIVTKISPDVIAGVKGYKEAHMQRCAKLTGATLKYVTKIIGNHSSSRILTNKG